MSANSSSVIVNANAHPRIVPVVYPPSPDCSSGRIKNVKVRGVDTSGWLTDDGEGGWALTKAMERKGYKLLEDYYHAESNIEGWHAYRVYVHDWQKGRTTWAFPADLLPTAVREIQNGVIEDKYRDPYFRAHEQAPSKRSPK